MKEWFSLRTVRKKVLMLSKLAGVALIFSYIISIGLPVSEAAAFLIWLGFVLLLVLGIVFFMGCFITKPIDKLNASAKRMAGLDFSAPCNLVSTDEFGELSASLNTMAENLQQALARLEDGEIFGFLGPNGSGKSTTQKILTGILNGHGCFLSWPLWDFWALPPYSSKKRAWGVIRVHAILPLWKGLFLLSKLAVFLLSDLVFAVLLTLLNVGLADGAAVLPAVLLQTAILSLLMALVGLLCALLLKDFRQFTLAYLVIAIFGATPVFLSANTSVKFDWIGYHPFYHVYMSLKSAYFGTAVSSIYYAGTAVVIALLFLAVQRAFHREIGKEG